VIRSVGRCRFSRLCSGGSVRWTARLLGCVCRWELYWMLKRRIWHKNLFFSVIPFYLQFVLVHSANCVNSVYIEFLGVTLSNNNNNNNKSLSMLTIHVFNLGRKLMSYCLYMLLLWISVTLINFRFWTLRATENTCHANNLKYLCTFLFYTFASELCWQILRNDWQFLRTGVVWGLGISAVWIQLLQRSM
jgi:hypothetical protein